MKPWGSSLVSLLQLPQHLPGGIQKRKDACGLVGGSQLEVRLDEVTFSSSD